MLDLASKFQTKRGALNTTDANNLIEAARDGRGLTLTEMNTLGYIRDHYQMDAAARQILTIFVDGDTPPLAEQITATQAHFGVPGLQIFYDPAEINRQEMLAFNSFLFIDTLQIAFEQIFYNGEHNESPRSMMIDIFYEELNPDLFEKEEDWNQAIFAKLRPYLNTGKLVHLPITFPDDWSERDDWQGYPPEHRESTHDNWAYFLEMPTLSDHLQWIIIDRTGEKAPYIYGFN